MTQETKEVSLIDIGKGAWGMLPELPQITKRLLGLATLTPNSKRSMGWFFQEQAGRYPDRIFLRFEDKVMTYQETNERANQMARALAHLGVGPGDTVGLLSENRASVLLAVLASAKLGAVSALLNFNQRGEVQAHSLGLVKPKVLLLGQKGLEIYNELTQSPKAGIRGILCLTLDDEKTDTAMAALGQLADRQPKKNLPRTAQIVANQPLFYIFTSGTTGLPKASIMSNYRWLQAMNGMGSAVRLNETDVFYCCLPLYHNNALTVSLGVTLSAGASFALDEKFSVSRFWDRIRHYEATAFCYIGELLRYLLNVPKSLNDYNHQVRLITGNGLRPEIWSQFEQRFGIEQIYEFYGASESNLGFMNAFGLKETVGFTPLPFEIIEVDPETEEPVRDEKGRCVRVEKGQPGLLISEVTKRQPFDGYTNEQANQKKLLRGVFKKNDLWFNSGDLVREQGWRHIQFVDRLGDTFRWKGENVATSEVESVIGQLPWVEHVAVYGVKVPGADGRAGMAAVLVKPGAEFDAEGLADCVSTKLPTYACPLFVRQLTSLQTTGTHKIQKAQFKQEGFDTAIVSDPMYELVNQAGHSLYRRLDREGPSQER